MTIYPISGDLSLPQLVNNHCDKPANQSEDLAISELLKDAKAGKISLIALHSSDRLIGLFNELLKTERPIQASTVGAYTVADAMRDYVLWHQVESQSTKSISTTASMVHAHILPALGNVPLNGLTSEQINQWHQTISATPARLRTQRGCPQQYRSEQSGRERQRQRKATANRILTVLKAALNRAYRFGKVDSPDAWRRVASHRRVGVAKIRYLSLEECRCLISVAPMDLSAMIRAALFTGCRYGELAALKVGDFNPVIGSVAIRFSKSGKPRHVPLNDEGRTFFDKIVEGRLPDAQLFLRTNGKLWGDGHQFRPMVTACGRAKIVPPVSFHILRHTYASHLAMNSVPLVVISAALGHADSRMTERHYAHLTTDYIAMTLRAKLPKLGAA